MAIIQWWIGECCLYNTNFHKRMFSGELLLVVCELFEVRKAQEFKFWYITQSVWNIRNRYIDHFCERCLVGRWLVFILHQFFPTSCDWVKLCVIFKIPSWRDWKFSLNCRRRSLKLSFISVQSIMLPLSNWRIRLLNAQMPGLPTQHRKQCV